MERRWLPRLLDLPGLVALAAMAWWLVRTTVPRLSYPFDLEWMEGGMLVHALRVSQGLPLYTTPSAEWIPYIYPPLYPWLIGGLGLVFGVDYPVGRAVSLLGVLAACGALVVAVRREGGTTMLGAAGAALFLSAYEDSGAFYDLVRADGLLVGLLAWSLVCVRSGRVATGGLLLVLAWLAKHNAAAFGLPLLLWLWWARGRGQALRFFVASVVPALLVLAWLQLSTDGLFLVYLLEVPSHHPFKLERFFPGAPGELAGAMPVAVGLAVAGLGVALVRGWSSRHAQGREGWEGGVFWTACGGLAVLLCMVMRGHHGGYLNVLVPGHWALALGGALGAIALRRALPGPVVVFGTALVLGGQAWQGRWTIEAQQPTAADLQAGQELLGRLQAIDGPVLMPHSPWYPVKVGKAPSFPLIALWDIEHGGRLAAHALDLDRALAEQRWSAVILADRKLDHGLGEHYRPAETLRYTGRAFYPKTGWQVRPRFVYLPRSDAD